MPSPWRAPYQLHAASLAGSVGSVAISCFWHYGQAWFDFMFLTYGWAWFTFLTQNRVEIILNCFVGSVPPQTLLRARHQFLIWSLCFLVVHLCLYLASSIVQINVTWLPRCSLYFNLNVYPILMHLAWFSHSMYHWVVCQNLPCSETCCWRSHKLCRWVHSMWIPVATPQKMVSTAIIPVWLSCFNMGLHCSAGCCFNMGLHCSAGCCFAAHAWRAFLQFAICYPMASQLNATRVDWVDLCCHHSSSMGFLHCFFSGSNMVWLYQWQLGVEMSSIKLSWLLGELMWSGKFTFVNAGTKEWSHSINNSLSCYLYPTTMWSCAETAFMAFKASSCHSLWTCYWHCSRSSCRHYGWSCCWHHCSQASCQHHGQSSILLHFRSCYLC